MRCLIIHNPASGTRSDEIYAFAHALAQAGDEITMRFIGKGMEPQDATRDVTAFDRVVVSGGDGTVSLATDNARMFMPLAELVDLDKERERIKKELANAEKMLAGQNAKLANENFVSRAPEKVVNAEREKKAKLEALIENLEDSLKNLG